ncbi:MAG: helix-turn-helix transcriptional regulator [Deltaproteobacteria bacterium]|nr:helix-turn-helix transcriptional regulator [Deltaproteobacteria bacterium]MBF0107220.1 helix-turn-helix transcriptional regulator [Deltaproteobacteria bacterium]
MNTDAKKFLEKQIGRLTLGGLLNSIRLGEELSQDEFSKLLGISKSHLCDIEKGRKFVSPERAEFFAKKLKYSAHQFVRLALQDLINNTGLKYAVEVHAL